VITPFFTVTELKVLPFIVTVAGFGRATTYASAAVIVTFLSKELLSFVKSVMEIVTLLSENTHIAE